MTDPIIVSVRREGSGYVVCDARGREHRADAGGLEKLLRTLTADETLPRIRTQKRDDMVAILAGIARRVVPDHAAIVDVTEPMAHHLTDLVKTTRRRSRARAGGSR